MSSNLTLKAKKKGWVDFERVWDIKTHKPQVLITVNTRNKTLDIHHFVLNKAKARAIRDWLNLFLKDEL